MEASFDDLSCRLNGGIATNSAENELLARGKQKWHIFCQISGAIRQVATEVYYAGHKFSGDSVFSE
jgi:hypothetical protein